MLRELSVSTPSCDVSLPRRTGLLPQRKGDHIKSITMPAPAVASILKSSREAHTLLDLPVSHPIYKVISSEEGDRGGIRGELYLHVANVDMQVTHGVGKIITEEVTLCYSQGGMVAREFIDISLCEGREILL